MKDSDIFEINENPIIQMTSLEPGWYDFTIKDFNKYRTFKPHDVSKHWSMHWIIVFEVILGQGFEEYNREVVYDLHFPHRTFVKAWKSAKQIYDIDPGMIYDCYVQIWKKKKKLMYVMQKKFIEIGKREEVELEYEI